MKYTGDYFGYPRCCQRAFLPLLLGREYPTLLQTIAGQSTGFIPCPEHARDVMDGRIALASLIEHRVCKKPFPNSGGNKDFFAFCATLEDEP